MVFLPDLVKEIIVFHIRDQMWKDEEGLEKSSLGQEIMKYNFEIYGGKMKKWVNAGFLARVRKLDDETIEQICKAFMKLF